MSVKCAVIGLGKMGLSHLAIANAIDGVDVVAVCDTMPLLGGVTQKYTGLRSVGLFEEALAIPGLDAVVIATPTTTHDAMASAAIERGIHIFCEKPLTLTAAASRALAQAAAARGLVAQAGYHHRYIGTFREARRLLDAGAIGQVTHAHAEAYGSVVLKPAKATWRGSKAAGGGCLYDYAVHPLNLLNWYLGEVRAVGGALLKSGYSAEVDDQVYATLGFDDGVTAQLSVDWSDPSVRKMTTAVTLWGTGGRIRVDRQEVQVFLTGSADVPPGYRTGWTQRNITELTPPVSFYLRGEEYSAQLESFRDAVVARGVPEENDFASAAATDAAAEMIRAAAEGAGAAGRFAAAAPTRAPGLIGRVLGR